jgi:cell division protein FtsB
MRELEQRQKMRRKLYSLPALAILFIVAVAMVRGAYAMLVKERESAKGAENLAAEVAALSERETLLLRELEKLETPAGIEEEIKSKFNVAKEGELVAVIVDRPEDEATTTPEKKSWFKRFWDDIMGANE